ncbi:ribonuclease H-like domain-containing protein [Tanacetum coccineum]
MAVDDSTPPPPPSSTDKIIPFSIPNKVPIKLDLEKHNYNSWSSFSLIHLGSLGLKPHVETDTTSTNPEWCQLDDLIKMWILSSLCDSLQEQVVTTPGTAKQLWDHLKDLFHDNKDARALNLDNELRTIKIGKMTINEYCTKIKSMADRLKKSCFGPSHNQQAQCVNTPRTITPQAQPTAYVTPIYYASSGPVQVAQSVPHQQQQPTTVAKPTVYLAQQQAHMGQPMTHNNRQGILGAAPVMYASQPTSLPSAYNTMTLQDPTWNMDTCATSHLNNNAHNLSTLFNTRLHSSIHVGDGNSIPVTNTGHNIIHSLHRPLHLNNVIVTPNIIKNLISVRQFTRDNNCTIEFDAFGFSVKDFLTRHILLRCDSSGDLYPVTKPSTTPVAFMSTSSTTWHQRLGHPGDEVLRSLSSRHFISCNKEKSSHVCHACQLVKNGTWILVLRPTDVNLVRSMWLFKHKFHADGTLSRYKARLVANDSSQQLGVDFDKTFSPVFKPATIHTVLSLAVSRQWPIHQLDVKNAFLNGDLSESYATRAGFTHNRCDSSLFIYTQGSQVAYFLIYVDDIILTASSPALLQQIIASLHKEFDMTDLRALNYFLGISAVRHSTGLFLSQKKYAIELLARAHMVNCNSSRTLVDSEAKLGPDGVPVQDPTLYRSLAEGLQYLTFT